MQVIETQYNGYLFRSRLEARWAVFFDACGVEWEYEPEGFKLPDGTCYLPDFLLRDVLIRNEIKSDLWIEVKARMTETDAKKIIAFANSLNDYCGVENFEHSILVLPAVPAGDEFWDIADNVMRQAYIDTYAPPFNFKYVDGDCFGAMPCINKREKLALLGDDSNYLRDAHYEATAAAYRKARQARFEHNQRPKPFPAVIK